MEIPFTVVSEIPQRPGNVGRLFSFVAAAYEQDAPLTDHCVIDPVARPPIDPQFAHALPQGLAVAKVTYGNAVNSAGNSRLCVRVRQVRQPIVEDISSGAVDVMPNLNHTFDCNL